jgi:hypothetical protein
VRDVFEVVGLAGIELARFLQLAAREGPFLYRGLAALCFPGSNKYASFEAAQIGEAAR